MNTAKLFQFVIISELGKVPTVHFESSIVTITPVVNYMRVNTQPQVGWEFPIVCICLYAGAQVGGAACTRQGDVMITFLPRYYE